ncbi:glycosyl transferase [Prevotella communis]|uniref:ATP-grasp fold amidoligase family protein n=1 Tax=Prevotella communis TaxID=2913614 RepID=UPI001EDC7FE3|nr:ATP-grasp fold amidoligase family protein [Prevotella communis]UKK59603.1 glycosyl transferase [Prevotella communis]
MKVKNTRTFFCKLKRYLIYKFAKCMSDRHYLETLFPLSVGYELDLENPQTYNEKLQWLKLYDRRPEYTKMVDKIEAKDYVSGIIGVEYIIPTIAVYNSPEEIDFEKLPEKFVLKCTHDSGGIVVCKDKSHLNKKETLNKLSKGLQRNYYYQNREWPYKNVVPRIIAEQYMEDEDGELKDYKFFCFNGEPKYMFIASDRFNPNEETKFDFFDMAFNHLPFINGHPNATKKVVKPKGFEEMKIIAGKLSKGIPQVRVDFYDINGKVYFGEMTFFHWSGLVPFEPVEWDRLFGESIILPSKHK